MAPLSKEGDEHFSGARSLGKFRLRLSEGIGYFENYISSDQFPKNWFEVYKLNE